ncbi:MAG TPA: DEAD/DEAH box helicase [Gammaproteobacteria bacterium]|jgi:superfamily II DNA/RNA helicase|nr:DEAD/DEAH box helicase [Gammaproteobacteria bacterium]
MSFEQFNLHASLAKGIAACGYTNPTPVQAQSIPPILAGKDAVVSAQTGTGKTAAFVLPALHHLSLQEPSKKTRVLILTPTRELAGQITKVIGSLSQFLKFNIVSLVGGMPYPGQIRDLARGADIIVATPGRLLDHIEQKRIDLSHINMLVLDEADRMLDMGFIEDVEYIAKLTPKNRQTLLFSATVDKKLATIVRDLLNKPVRIDLSTQTVAAPKITQEMYKAKNQAHKLRLLKHFLNNENVFKAIIFSATKINADRLTEQLRDQGFAAAALHGDLRQNVRNRTLEKLRHGKIQFLIATDVAARGIDIDDITLVINYDLPRTVEDYVHRIGRTGRAGKIGTAVSFITTAEMHQLQRIERYIGQRIKVIQHIDIDDAAIDEKLPERVAALKLAEDSERRTSRGRSERSQGHGKRRQYSRDDDREPSDARKKRFGKSERDYAPARGEDRKFGDSKKKHFEKPERDFAPARGEDRKFGDSKKKRFEKPERDFAPVRGEDRKFGDSKKKRFGKPERDHAPARGEDRKFGDSKKKRFGKPERDDAPARGEERKFGDSKKKRFGKPERDDAPARGGERKFGDSKKKRFGKPERDFVPARGEDRKFGDSKKKRFGKPERDDAPTRGGERKFGETRKNRFEKPDSRLRGKPDARDGFSPRRRTKEKTEEAFASRPNKHGNTTQVRFGAAAAAPRRAARKQR